MSGIEIGLWIALVVSVLYYIWVGHTVVSQPRFNWPALFRNHAVAAVLINLPFAAFLAIVVAAFLLTEQGWWFLAAAVGSFFLFAVRPQPF